MSIEIDWKRLTTGPDGLALAESIREFIHDKFQQVELPRFIRAVEVHSFEFGEESPSVVLKDVTDPLPDFYEDDDEDDDEDGSQDGEEEAAPRRGSVQQQQQQERQDAVAGQASARHSNNDGAPPPPLPPPLSQINTQSFPRLQSTNHFGVLTHHHRAGSPSLLSTSGTTPGIPGGTSNMNTYFHLPLSARLPGGSGTQTPLAAVAGGGAHHSFRNVDDHDPWGYPYDQASPATARPRTYSHSHDDLSTRPSTATSYHAGSGPNLPLPERSSFPPAEEPDPLDLQVVLHISYTGSVRLCLTAEILLDYPMPSFVGIPLKLNITGVSFDGVALLAYLKKGKAHFCFLGQEDAEMLVGAQSEILLNDDDDDDERQPQARTSTFESRGGGGGISGLGGLLREMRVESEIGYQQSPPPPQQSRAQAQPYQRPQQQQQPEGGEGGGGGSGGGGKQSLKNVGKVEKFVLEQVRRIFEDEFVYPSFWTFLV